MAGVNIYREHRAILDELLTSRNTRSVAAAVDTGPFTEQRDVYIFAASIGIAIGQPADAAAMPTDREDITLIRDNVFFAAKGSLELCHVVGLIQETPSKEAHEALSRQITLISKQNTVEQLEILDRYAYAGFEWLRVNRTDEACVRDLVFSSIEQIRVSGDGTGEGTLIDDPIIDLFGAKL